MCFVSSWLAAVFIRSPSEVSGVVLPFARGAVNSVIEHAHGLCFGTGACTVFPALQGCFGLPLPRHAFQAFVIGHPLRSYFVPPPVTCGQYVLLQLPQCLDLARLCWPWDPLSAAVCARPPVAPECVWLRCGQELDGFSAGVSVGPVGIPVVPAGPCRVALGFSILSLHRSRTYAFTYFGASLQPHFACGMVRPGLSFGGLLAASNITLSARLCLQGGCRCLH